MNSKNKKKIIIAVICVLMLVIFGIVAISTNVFDNFGKDIAEIKPETGNIIVYVNETPIYDSEIERMQVMEKAAIEMQKEYYIQQFSDTMTKEAIDQAFKPRTEDEILQDRIRTLIRTQEVDSKNFKISAFDVKKQKNNYKKSIENYKKTSPDSYENYINLLKGMGYDSLDEYIDSGYTAVAVANAKTEKFYDWFSKETGYKLGTNEFNEQLEIYNEALYKNAKIVYEKDALSK